MTNEILERNLQAFFARYPHERARLEPVLRAPSVRRDLPDIEPPSPPQGMKPPMRLMLMLGIVNPMLFVKLFNNPVIQREMIATFIFENDPEFLAFIFQAFDLTQIINYGKTHWFLCHDVASLKPALFQVMKMEHIASIMFNVQSFRAEAETKPECERFYGYIENIYNETSFHVLHNYGNIDDSLLGVEVTLRNKKFVLDSPGIKDLEDRFKGQTALLCGAGPSLDENLDKIKKHNDKFVVIAADAALKPLIAKGIRVDYVTSVERLNAYQKPFFENCPETGAELVAYPVVHPEVLEMFPGQVRIVYRNYSFYAYFEKAWPKGILRSGGSTSHLGLRLADYMGCTKLLMIGLDSCYLEKDGLYRSHCIGTGHPDWGHYLPIEEFAKKYRHAPPLKAINNLGEESMTNMTYYQWSKEYSEELALLGHRISFINCAAKGLRVSGVPYQDLDEVAATLPVMNTAKPKGDKAVFNRSWDHKELRRNLEKWAELCQDAIKESDELLSQEQMDLDRFQALFYVYQFRLMIDDMFVSFVVQCCAKEFFQLDNEWWSFELSLDSELPEKVGVLKKKFILFKSLLDRLAKMFEEGKDGIEIH